MILNPDMQSNLQRMINSLAAAMDVEVAVFDNQCQLVLYTQPYLRHKGKTVHTPSIEEVMQEGKMIVNEPGRMASCTGCRFKDNCPSTIEILNCIRINRYTFGVVALTSFTQEGHARISNNPAVYLNLSEEIAQLIGTVLLQGTGKNRFSYLDDLLQAAIAFSRDPVVAIDHNGQITHSNEAALDLFSFCNLSTTSLRQILPAAVLNSILEGEAMEDRAIHTAHFTGNLHMVPVMLDDAFAGAVLTIQQSRRHPSADLLPARKSDPGKEALDEIVGRSPAIQALKQDLVRFAGAPSPVLITGATGTGKELAALALHANSPRHSGPFVAVNCASIPETLFESELFGYMEGAFTGAKKGGKPGRFQMAQGGSLFLDEIGEMPLAVQAKLLRVLQHYTVEPIGGTRPVPVDVRVIAATNQDLETLVQQKKFRADLFYRINVIPLHLPPLKDRREDLPDLCRHFAHRYSRLLHKPIERFTTETIERLYTHDWPGNVRELENAVEYAVNVADTPLLSEQHLPQRLKDLLLSHPAGEPLIREKVNAYERQTIETLLAEYGRHQKGKQKVADTLGISLSTLYRKLRSHAGP